MERTPAPSELVELVERYQRNRDAYEAPGYKEAQLRKEFIDPLLEILGWDVSNKQGAAPAYKEVIHEDTLRIGGSTEAPDYSLRIGQTRKLFVEAKKPSVRIREDPVPALQLRRYGWNAKLPLCILTNFEEFLVYDTRIRPKEGDVPSVGLRRHFTLGQLVSSWDVVNGTFSRQAIVNGSFDKYAESWKDVKGTAEVDQAFLEDIETWRDELARVIALRNPSLSQLEMNQAVQSTIDRIVFLRICEDRGIETYGRLQVLLKAEGCYERLKEFYRLADERYNSGLFYFGKEKGRNGAPDTLTPKLNVDDKVLRDIVKGLYFPASPYEFSVMPAEILGQVYEQFLGKVIRLTPAHRAVVEEKPEVKKAGGVYYTPAYVVRYIVENTLRPLVDGKTPEQVAKLRIVDPACGSGSFLIAAYQFLLDWHLNWYVQDGPKNHKEQAFQGEGESWFLTSAERRRILLNNIFGVDIDAQAVEVTKLSLLLKVLEQVSRETIDKNQKLFHQRALPDLENNIKCGNSLVGTDFYQARQTTLFDDEQRLRINAFDWAREFPAMAEGGFSAVIGNPPYIPIETMQEWEKQYFQEHHPELERKYDSSVVFILTMMEKLKSGGLLGFISSVTWQTGENYRKLRETLFRKYGVRLLVNLPFDVFKNAYVDTGVYVLSAERADAYNIFRFPKKDKSQNLDAVKLSKVPTSLVSAPDYKVVLNPLAQEILSRVSSSRDFVPFGEFTESTQGLAGNMFHGQAAAKGTEWFPYLEEGQVYRYTLEVKKTSFVNMGEYPSLKPFYEAKPKLLVRRVINRQDRLMAAFSEQRLLCRKDLNPFVVASGWDPKFVLAVLNSRLISYLYVNTSSIATKDDFRQTTLAELRRLPIPRYDAGNADHVRLAQDADRLTALATKIPTLKGGQERTVASREFDALDLDIDRTVYRLYGLSKAEVQRVESGV